jgi:hypothetical protein
MRHSPTDLSSPIEILEARYAEMQRAASDASQRDGRERAAPTRSGRQDDRPAGRMTLLAVE